MKYDKQIKWQIFDIEINLVRDDYERLGVPKVAVGNRQSRKMAESVKWAALFWNLSRFALSCVQVK